VTSPFLPPSLQPPPVPNLTAQASSIYKPTSSLGYLSTLPPAPSSPAFIPSLFYSPANPSSLNHHHPPLHYANLYTPQPPSSPVHPLTFTPPSTPPSPTATWLCHLGSNLTSYCCQPCRMFVIWCSPEFKSKAMLHAAAW
jgi:hypothetical protein